MRAIRYVLLSIIVVLLISCAPKPLSAPTTTTTATPMETLAATATATSEPATATIAPSLTPASTFTPTPAPTLALPVSPGTALPGKHVLSPENISDITRLARWNYGEAKKVEFSPQGRFLAVHTFNHLNLYETEHFSLAKAFLFDQSFQFALSPDDRLLAMQTEDGITRVVDTKNWAQVAQIEGYPSLYDYGSDRFYRLSFSPDGALLAVSSAENRMVLWNTTDWTAEQELEALGVTFSPDGSYMALIMPAAVEVRTWPAGGTISSHPINFDLGGSIAFSADGQTIAVIWTGRSGIGLADNANIYRATDGVLLGYVENFGELSLDGKMVAETGNGCQIKLYSMPGSQVLQQLNTGDTRCGYSVHSAVSADSGLFFTDSARNELIAWDIVSGDERYRLAHGSFINDLSTSPDNRLVASASQDGLVRVFAQNDGAQVAQIDGYWKLNFDEKLHVSSNGKAVVSVNHSEGLLWNTADGIPVRFAIESNPEDEQNFTNWVVSPDGKYFYFLGNSGSGDIELYDATTHQRIAQASAGVLIRSLAFSPDGTRLAVSNGEDRVALLRLPELTLERFLSAPNCCGEVAFSPDGTMVVSGGAGQRVYVWNPLDGTQITTFSTAPFESTAFLFTPDGKRLILSMGKRPAGERYFNMGIVQIWDVETWQMEQEISLDTEGMGSEDEGTVSISIALSPTADLLAVKVLRTSVYSLYNRLLMYEPGSGTLMAKIDGFLGAPIFSPAGDVLYGTGEILDVWGLPGQ